MLSKSTRPLFFMRFVFIPNNVLTFCHRFIVANNLTEQEVIDKAETLSFPKSVIEYFQGFLGIPPFGFPEPLRSRVLKGRTIEGYDQLQCFEGRPGADLNPYDFDGARAKLTEKWKQDGEISDVDVMSHIMYPNVFDECKLIDTS